MVPDLAGWLADPSERSVEVFRFDGPSFTLVGTYGGDDAIRAQPFEDVQIPPDFIGGRQPNTR